MYLWTAGAGFCSPGRLLDPGSVDVPDPTLCLVPEEEDFSDLGEALFEVVGLDDVDRVRRNNEVVVHPHQAGHIVAAVHPQWVEVDLGCPHVVEEEAVLARPRREGEVAGGLYLMARQRPNLQLLVAQGGLLLNALVVLHFSLTSNKHPYHTRFVNNPPNYALSATSTGPGRTWRRSRRRSPEYASAARLPRGT